MNEIHGMFSTMKIIAASIINIGDVVNKLEFLWLKVFRMAWTKIHKIYYQIIDVIL